MKHFPILILCIALTGCQSNRVVSFESVAAELPMAQAAAIKAGVPLKMRDLAPPPLKPEDNAAPLLAKAHDDLPIISENIGYMMRSEDKAERARAERHVEEADRAVDLIVEATNKPGANFERDWDLGRSAFSSRDQEMMATMSKWVCARAAKRTRDGDTLGAMSDLRAGFILARFARSQPRPAYLISEMIVIEGVKTVVSQSPGNADLLAGLRAVLKDQDGMSDFWNIIRGQALDSIDFCDQVAKMPRDGLESLLDDKGRAFEPPVDVPVELAATAYKVRVMQVWTEIANRVAAKDYKLNPNEIVEDVVSRAKNSPDRTYDVVNYEVASGAGVLVSSARIRTIDALLAALQYRQKHGKMPQTLADAGFETPDPYTGKPLKVKVEGDTIAIWSVGSNGVDDGGEAKQGKDFVARFPR